MTDSIKYLDWDSSFFGYNIGLLISKNFTTIKDLNKILSIAKEQNYRLLYFKSSSIEPLFSLLHNPIQFVLADKKVTFHQSLKKSNHIETYPQITLYSDTSVNIKLLDITLQSGVYSRFAIDPNFDNQEYEKLYTEWIKKSVTREIAKEVWVHLDDKKEINGLITLGKKNNAADIGLLAVDKDTRGLNIGTKLIELAKLRAIEWGETELQVVTQLENHPACQFYKKQGFEIIEIEYIYHIWL